MQTEFLPKTGQMSDVGRTCERGHNQTQSESMSSAEGSRARTSVRLAIGKGSTESEVVCFSILPESFASFDRQSWSWRTRQRLLGMDLEEFSVSFPQAGLMLSGRCYRRRHLERRTKGRGRSLLPTPKASDGERGGRGDLLTVLRGYQTRHAGTLPTPLTRNRTQDATSRTGAKSLAVMLSSLAGGRVGQTNPRFLEWMMGFPIGWTELDASETQCLRSLPSGSEDE